LCIVRGLELLRIGGRLASFVPESFLSSPRYERGRAWLLEHATLRAIISLPPEAFMPVGHAGKASLLLIDNKSTEADDEILVVDVQNVGYDRFGHSTRENQLPEVTKLMSRFNEGLPLGIQDIFASSGIKRLRAWTVSAHDLDPSGLGLAKLDPRRYDVLHSLLRGRYPVAKLDQIVEVIGGRNFKSYVDDPAGAALLIQAGNVRESELQLANAPYISMDDYWSAPRAQVKIGDVLITTTGAYLGRTALVGSLPRSSSASGAVTILRPNSDIDPSYLEAILNSEIGSEQITKLRAASSAQPFIRRKDLGELLIPLPPLAHQRALANRITEMLDEARGLAEKARQLEEEARRTVVSEILGGSDNE
jgi:type I restriction enzyme M protein